MKPIKLITLIAATGIALTACGNDEPQNAEEAQQEYADQLEAEGQDPMEAEDDFNPMDGMGPMTAGEFETYSTEGAHIVFNLPADTDNEHIAEVEQYRDAAGIDAVTYLTADVDNREGTDSVNMYQVKAFDEDGNEYAFEKLDMAMYEWSPYRSYDIDNEQFELPDGTPTDEETYLQLDEQMSDITENLVTNVSASGRDTIILTYEGDDLPDEFTRVAVWPNGAFEEAEAYPTN